MAGEKYNIQLEAAEIFNRLVKVPELVQGLNELLQNFNSHNHDARNDERYQPLGNYAASVHEHQASDIQETTDKKVMTAEERNILSTLGTTYAKADLSNAMTVNLGRNGYAKFNNGLLIQWGFKENSIIGGTIVYFPMSFYDSNYALTPFPYGSSGDTNILAAFIYNANTSYCYIGRRNISNGNPVNSMFSVGWIAVGRWK